MRELALPEGWNNDSLETFLSFALGGDWGKPADYDDSEFETVYCIRGTEISHWAKTSGSTAVERKIKATSLEKRKLQEGDLLVEISGGGPDQPVGRTVVIDKKVLNKFETDNVICTNFLRMFRPIKSINSKFLNFYLQMFYSSGYINEYQSGSNNLRNLKFKEFLTIDVPFAPIDEQNAIVSRLEKHFETVSQIQARLDAIPKLIEKFRQSVLSDAVSGKVICNDEDKFKLVRVENTWKHDVIGLNNWKQYRLSEVISFIGGSQPPKSEFINEPREEYVRLIQIRDYKTDKYKAYIPIEKARRLVNKNEIMIGRYGPPIFQILRGLEGAYNVALMKAEPKTDNLDIEFLYYYLQNYKLYNYIESASDRTAGQSGVNKKHLEGYPILLPPLDEQLEIVSRVKALLEHANQIEKSVATAKARVDHLTQSILHQAFTGNLTAEWREQNPDVISGEKSAEALLAKIKAEKQGSGKKVKNV